MYYHYLRLFLWMGGLLLCAIPTTFAQSNLLLPQVQVTPNATIPAGGGVTVAYDVLNNGLTGTSNATSFRIGFYLSTDSIPDPSDVFLGGVFQSPMGPGQLRSGNENLIIPLNTPPAGYYLLSYVDDLQRIGESDEQDNVVVHAVTIGPALPDFVPSVNGIHPFQAVVNDSCALDYTVQNNGSTKDSIRVRFYLSRNHLYDVADTLLGEVWIDRLANNGLYQDTMTFVIPGTTYPRAYYVLVYVDPLQEHPESVETNNVANQYVRIHSERPDLRVVDYIVPDSIMPGENPIISWTINNHSTTLARTTYTGIYLSTDTLIDATDVVLLSSFQRSISGNATSYGLLGVNIPTNTPLGNYYLILQLDDQQIILEKDEQNNISYKPVRVVAPLPDLIIGSAFINPWSGSFMAGQTIPLQFWVSNLGVVPSQPSTLGYYWSPDPQWDPTDVYIGQDTVPVLLPSTNPTAVSFPTTVQLPNGLNFGRQYLITYIDADQRQAEVREDNNTRALPIVIVGNGPSDLTVRAVSLDAPAVRPGGMVQTSAIISNVGERISNSNRVGYYLSTDTLYDAGDLLLSDEPVAFLVPNDSIVEDEVLTIPNLPAGQYYVLWYVDDQNIEVESDETNNVGHVPLLIDTMALPDFTVQIQRIEPDTATVGQGIVVRTNLSNQGNSGTNLGWVHYYISTDTLYDSTDVLLHRIWLPYLGAQQVQADSTFIRSIPDSVPQGDYYLLCYVDALEEVVESNEQNNVGHRPLSVLGNPQTQPDLAILNQSQSIAVPEQGQNLLVTTTVNNLNTVLLPYTGYLAHYLSTDTIYDAGDVFLNDRSIGSINHWSPTSIGINIAISPTTTPGQYYLLTRVDDRREVAESNEQNNLLAMPITIIPARVDLQISNASVSRSFQVSPGEVVTLRSSGRNLGLYEGAGPSYMGYYLSTDATYDALDVYLGERYRDTILPGQNYGDTAMVRLPATIAVGNYYVLFYDDHRNAVTERVETNNIRAVPLSIGTGTNQNGIDLRVSNPFRAATTVAPSSILGLSCTVSNRGNVSANLADVGYYLSPLSTYNSGMVELSDDYLGNIAPNGSVNDVQNVMIPPGTPAGNYHILYYADHDDILTEINETNNLTSRTVTVSGTAATGVDLVVDVPATSSRNTAGGAALTLSSTVRNLGSNAGSTHLGYYLSTDRVLSSSDVFLDSSFVGPLTANGAQAIAKAVTIPTSTTPGTYFILFYADYNRRQSEHNETNNIIYRKIEVGPSLPDLTVASAILQSSIATVGQTLGVSHRVQNNGSTSSRDHATGYYLSTTPSYTPQAIPLGGTYFQTVGGNSSVRKSTVLPLPLVAAGNYYLLVYTDHFDVQPETDETNNVFALPLQLLGNPVLQADLVVRHPQADSTQLPVGNTMTVSCWVHNQAGGTATGTLTGYYLSTDTIWQPSDLRLRSSSAAALPAGDSTFQTTQVSIPNTTPLGNYYLIYVADETRLQAESEENNNWTWLPLRVMENPADLVVRQPSATPSSLLSGDRLALRATVYNQGNGPAQPTRWGAYLSTDNQYDVNDVLLTHANTPALMPGDSSLHQDTITIAPNTPTGTYYILHYADDWEQQPEQNDSNNVGAVPIFITLPQPDLVIPQASVNQNTPLAGNSITVTALVENQGLVNAGPTQVGYYLSVDTLYDATDVLLGNSSIGALNPTANTTATQSLTIAGSTAPGNYYLLCYADHLDTLAEAQEQNNTRAIALTILPALPDLRVENINIPASVGVGAAFTVSSTIRNGGQGPAGGSKVAYYLSTLPVLNGSATQIGADTVPRIAALNSQPMTTNLTLPNGLAPGFYYVIVEADYLDSLSESNENNNTASRRLEVLPPDLLPQNVSLSRVSLLPSDTIELTGEVYNQGAGKAGAHTVGYYWTTNPSTTTGALLLGRTSIDSLLSNGQVNLSERFPIPVGTTPGTYYVIVEVDDQQVLAESNEFNNRIYRFVTINSQLPDLVCVNANPTLQVGSNLNLSARIVNQSNVGVGSSEVGYYLSTDLTHDASDVLLGTQLVSALAPNANYLINTSLPIPAGMTSGTYYVVYVADHANAWPEHDETNNKLFEAVQISVSTHRLPAGQFRVYPNPTKGTVVLDWKTIHQEVEVSVYNALGQVVHQQTAEAASQMTLTWTGPAGWYTMVFQTASGILETAILIKE